MSVTIKKYTKSLIPDVLDSQMRDVGIWIDIK